MTSALCALLLEVTVRWCLPYYAPSALVLFRRAGPDLVLGPPMETLRLATPKGDYDTWISFNAAGFRDTKSLHDSTEKDWFALGDSFTIGMGVDEDKRYSNVLEGLFKTNGFKLSVFNIAIPDNFIGYQRLLKYAESQTTNIHRLIVGVCMENDIRDYRDGKSAWDFQLEKPKRLQKFSSLQNLQDWFRHHSALYIALSYEIQKTPLGRRLFERLGVARPVNELSRQNHYDETVLASSRDELLKIVSGREALVLLIPSRLLWAGNDREVERRVHERFVELLTAANVPVVDLRPVFEQEEDPLKLYFLNDPHWNNRGHAVAAAALFRRIHEGLPDTRSSNQP